MGIHILLSFPLGVQVKISPEALEERVAIYPPPSQAGLEGRGGDPHRTSSLLSLAPSPLLRVSFSPKRLLPSHCSFSLFILLHVTAILFWSTPTAGMLHPVPMCFSQALFAGQ